jgi:hypothetical protein
MVLMKKCFKCNINKNLTEFYRHSEMKDGYVNKCKECNKQDVRRNYSYNKQHYQKYDKNRQRMNKTRIFNHRYSQIKQRVEGRAARKYFVEGMDVLSYSEYSKWVINNMEQFESLYNEWVKSGFKRKYTPSIDRINNTKGYTSDNMRWITQSDNSKKYNKKFPF